MLDACLPPTALRDYLAGHTSSELTADIELHLQHCAACQQRLATVDASGDSLVSLLREAAVPHSGEDPLATGVLSAILSYRPSDQVLDGVQVPDVGSSISNYRLIEKIGEGGMGTVYLAIHTWLDKPMAVKLLKANRLSDPDAVGRFQREMRAVGKLQHPNIVGAYDAGEENGVPYLAMEYVAGIDVLELVRRIGPLTIPDACEMTRQAALALHHAHQHGLVHRDVKSSNLMLTSDGCIKVLDLGLAQWVLHDDSQLTSDGQVLGTLRYIAPEQLRPGAEVDAASDIYSLGVTLCELLLGADVFRCLPIPVDGGSLTSLRPDVPAGLQALIEQMTARRREKRPASMLAVAKALDLYSRPAKLRELTRFCAGSALQPVVHDGLSVALPRQADNAALATVRIALQSTDVVPPPVAPPPIAPLMSQQVTSASDEPLHMHWPLSLYTLFGAGLATVIVLLAGLTVAFWSMPTKADRARQLVQQFEQAMSRADFDAAQRAVAAIAALKVKEPSVSELTAQIASARQEQAQLAAEQERERLAAAGEQLWQATSRALAAGDVAAARQHLRDYLSVEGRPHANVAQWWLDECEQFLASDRTFQAVLQWNSAQLSAATQPQPTFPAGLDWPTQSDLFNLTKQKWIAAAQAEQQRRAAEAIARQIVGVPGKGLRSYLNMLNTAQRARDHRAVLASHKAARAQEDAAWRADPQQHGSLALVPHDAVAAIVIPNIEDSIAKAKRLAESVGLQEYVKLFELCSEAYIRNFIPFKFDRTQPVVVLLPTSKIFERDAEIAKCIVIGVVPLDRQEVAKALEARPTEGLRPSQTLECRATRFKQSFAELIDLGQDTACYARLRGKHVFYGFDRGSVEQAATATSMVSKMTAEAGRRLVKADVAVVANSSPWREAWKFDELVGGIANSQDPANLAADFLELAKCVDFGAASLNWDDGLSLSAFAVFSPHQDAAVDRIVPLLNTTAKASSLAGLPHDRAAWAFAASGDGPSNVVIAHGILQTSVDHFLVPRESTLRSDPFGEALTRALRQVKGSRAAIYHTGDGVEKGLFSSLIVVDSDSPAALADEIRGLVEQLNAEAQRMQPGQEAAVVLRRTKLDRYDMTEFVTGQAVADPLRQPEVERTLGKQFGTLRMVVQPRAVIFHIGDDLDVLRQCCRNLQETRLGLAEHAALQARQRQRDSQPGVEFHIAAQYFLEALEGKPVGNLPSPARYSSSELSLNLTRLRFDLHMPVEELRQYTQKLLPRENR